MQYFARYNPKTEKWLVYFYPFNKWRGRISDCVIDKTGKVTFRYTILDGLEVTFREDITRESLAEA